jgi:DNA-binding response OmpR family regulator
LKFKNFELANHYHHIKAVLAEPSALFRREIEAILKGMGFLNITSTGNLAAAEDVLRQENIALFIADTSLPEGNISETIRNIRLSKLGENPFVVCMTMISDPSEDKTREVENSGVDDIVVKPFQASQIRDRIAMLAHSRPRFVVTSDYIGPSRRSPERDKQEDDLFIVPNPLTSSISARNYNNSLKIIKEHRIVRDGLKINELTSMVSEKLLQGIDIADLKKQLDWLNCTAADLDGRLVESVNKPIRGMIMTLQNLSEKIISAGKADKDDIATLEKLGINIASRFDKKRLAFCIQEFERQTNFKQQNDADIAKNFQTMEGH